MGTVALGDSRHFVTWKVQEDFVAGCRFQHGVGGHTR